MDEESLFSTQLSSLEMYANAKGSLFGMHLSGQESIFLGEEVVFQCEVDMSQSPRRLTLFLETATEPLCHLNASVATSDSAWLASADLSSCTFVDDISLLTSGTFSAALDGQDLAIRSATFAANVSQEALLDMSLAALDFLAEPATSSFALTVTDMVVENVGELSFGCTGTLNDNASLAVHHLVLSEAGHAAMYFDGAQLTYNDDLARLCLAVTNVSVDSSMDMTSLDACGQALFLSDFVSLGATVTGTISGRPQDFDLLFVYDVKKQQTQDLIEKKVKCRQRPSASPSSVATTSSLLTTSSATTVGAGTSPTVEATTAGMSTTSMKVSTSTAVVESTSTAKVEESTSTTVETRISTTQASTSSTAEASTSSTVKASTSSTAEASTSSTAEASTSSSATGGSTTATLAAPGDSEVGGSSGSTPVVLITSLVGGLVGACVLVVILLYVVRRWQRPKAAQKFWDTEVELPTIRRLASRPAWSGKDGPGEADV
jgi:hypothetical protein